MTLQVTINYFVTGAHLMCSAAITAPVLVSDGTDWPCLVGFDSMSKTPAALPGGLSHSRAGAAGVTAAYDPHRQPRHYLT